MLTMLTAYGDPDLKTLSTSATTPYVKQRRWEEHRHEVANGKGGYLHHDLRQFHSFPSSVSAENVAFVNTQVDWKENLEAHMFKTDIPWLKKEHVKVASCLPLQQVSFVPPCVAAAAADSGNCLR
ncbi:hypothetical protein Fmac_003007 [Flemingia macrophylla]|uniref:Uncharacterized protein n=1 Tax=Flemingia macrophylla TaxID=520843 RepID=A0ABD1NMZ5_9FABA